MFDFILLRLTLTKLKTFVTAELHYFVIICQQYIFMVRKKSILSWDIESKVYYFVVTLLVWFIKITKVVSFKFIKVFRKDPFLALYFSLSSSMIFRPVCVLPSAALFTLTIWPFGLPLPWSPLWWRPHKELCFD